MKAPESSTGSGRLAPLVQAGLAALVAGSLLSFSAIAFNDGFTSAIPEEGVAASPIETGSGGPVVVPGMPGGGLTEPRSDLVAELPGPDERGRDDAVLGTRLDEAGSIPRIQERPSIAGQPGSGRSGDGGWGAPSGRDRGTEEGSGSPWVSPRDGQSGGDDSGPGGGGNGGPEGGGSDEKKRDPERPEAKPRDEDEETEARDDDDDDDDASDGSYHAAGHSGSSGKSEPSGNSIGDRRDKARPEEEPTVDEPTGSSDGNSQGSAGSQGSSVHGGGPAGNEVSAGYSGNHSGSAGGVGRSEGNHGAGNKGDGYFARGS